MLENLFIPDDPTSISSAEIELSEDTDSWPLEIQNAVISSVPVLGEVPGYLYLDALDKDKMYAKGSYVVKTPEDDIIIPIVIKAKKMSPVDLFIYKNRWYPMDMEDLIALLTSAQIGSGLMAREDVPMIATNRMPPNIMPPGSYGSGTGIITTVANKISSLNPKITNEIITTIQNNPGIIKKLATNKVAKNALIKTIETPYKEKNASTNPFINTDSVIVSLGKGRFSIKYAGFNSLDISEKILDGNELAQNLKEAGLDCGRIIKELMTKKVATSWDDSAPPIKQLAESLQPVKTAKMYKFYKKDNTGVQPAIGYVLATTKVAGVPKHIIMLNDGTYAMQEKVAGVNIATNYCTDFIKQSAKLASQIKVGDTIVVPIPTKSDKTASSSLPLMKVSNINYQKTATVISGKGESGDTALIVTADEFNTPIKAEHIPDDIMVSKSASSWYVPENYVVYQLPESHVSLINDAEDFKSSMALTKMASGDTPPILTANIWKTSPATYAIKLAGKAPAIKSEAETMLLLKKSLGSNVMDTLVKIASGIVKTIDLLVAAKPEKENDIAAKTNISSDNKKVSSLKYPKMRDTLKIAAILDSDEDINTVLSLNYITPENLMEFKAAVPDLKNTENTLTKLLMSTRLGNNIVDEKEVKNTLTSLHSIIKELDSTL